MSEVGSNGTDDPNTRNGQSETEVMKAEESTEPPSKSGADAEADPDENIDFSKIKKKKKKSTFKFDEIEAGIEPLEDGQDEVEQGARVKEQDADPKPGTDDTEDLDFMKLKKKKKKKVSFTANDIGGDTAYDEEDGSAVREGSGASAGAEGTSLAGVGDDGVEDDLDFNNMVKKKKKKKRTLAINDASIAEDPENPLGEDLDEAGCTASSSAAEAWSETDRDYTYEELLQRVINLMHERNPDFVAGDKRKLVMKPPQVIRVGTKKTSFANFIEITKTLRRTPKHLQAFLMAEMGTSGSIDANNQLIIKGRFQQKQIEHILRRYIKEYVTCHTCRAPETILEKDTRLNFLRCEKCGSRCSVQSIKSGFQAVTTKRAAIRARTA